MAQLPPEQSGTSLATLRKEAGFRVFEEMQAYLGQEWAKFEKTEDRRVIGSWTLLAVLVVIAVASLGVAARLV